MCMKRIVVVKYGIIFWFPFSFVCEEKTVLINNRSHYYYAYLILLYIYIFIFSFFFISSSMRHTWHHVTYLENLFIHSNPVHKSFVSVCIIDLLLDCVSPSDCLIWWKKMRSVFFLEIYHQMWYAWNDVQLRANGKYENLMMKWLIWCVYRRLHVETRE